MLDQLPLNLQVKNQSTRVAERRAVLASPRREKPGHTEPSHRPITSIKILGQHIHCPLIIRKGVNFGFVTIENEVIRGPEAPHVGQHITNC